MAPALPYRLVRWYDGLRGEPDVGISTAELRPAATAARRHETAWQIVIAAAGLCAGAGVAWVVSRARGDNFAIPEHPFAVPVIVLVGWSFIGGGLLYWRSRPDNRSRFSMGR